MSKVLLTAYLLTALSPAALAGGHKQLKDIELSLSGQKGALSATHILVRSEQSEIIYRPTALDLDFSGDVITLENQELKIGLKSDAKNILKSITQLDLQGGQVDYFDGSKIQAKLAKAAAALGDGVQSAVGVRLTCALDKQAKALDSCLQHLELTLDRIEVHPNSTKTVERLVPLELQDSLKTAKAQKLDDVYLNTGNGEFYLDLKIKALFKFTVKVSGDIIPAAEGAKRIGFRIERAKVSIFSIKGKLLKAIADAGIENVTVQGDTVFVDLN